MKLFAFDLDGTVIDSMPALTEAAVATICRFYHLTPEFARESYLRTVGIPFSEQLKLLFPESPNQEATEWYEEQHRLLCPTFHLAPGIERALRAVQEQGHRTALVTSTDYQLLEELPQVTVLDFDFLGGHRTGFPKTAQLYEAHMFWPEAELLLFGDSASDDACAKLAHATFHLVTCATVAQAIHAVLA